MSNDHRAVIDLEPGGPEVRDRVEKEGLLFGELNRVTVSQRLCQELRLAMDPRDGKVGSAVGARGREPDGGAGVRQAPRARNQLIAQES